MLACCRGRGQFPAVKSCLGLLLAMGVLVAVLATAGGLWYLSSSAEFGRKEVPAQVPAEVPGR